MRYQGFEPSFDCNAKVLILGSFPSVMSRAVSYYYGNPRNRFWRVLAECLGGEEPVSNEEKVSYIKQHRIALWDIVVSCEIRGSSDASIKSYEVANIAEVLDRAPIERIILNGGTAAKIFRKSYPELMPIAVTLPSTSPANFKFDIEAWREALEPVRR